MQAVLGLLSLAVVFLAVRTPADSSATKVSTIRLEGYGWRPTPTKPEERRRRSEWPNDPSKQVSVDHEGRVLVGFTVRENYDLAIRDHPGLSYHILRFTPEGRNDLSLVVPTNDYFTNGLYLGSKDQIFARANDAFQFLSAEGAAGKKDANWKVLARCSRYCDVFESPSRGTLIVRTHDKSYDFDNITYTIVDASSLPPHVVTNCSQMAGDALNITDTFTYWDGGDELEPPVRRFPLCDIEHGQKFGWGGAIHVLNDDAFLRFGGTGKHSRGEIELVDSRGEVKFRHEMREHEEAFYLAGEWVAADERGDRFACVADTWRGGSRSLDISGKIVARRIVVFDDTGRELASLPVTTAYDRNFDFSLSPDGHRLAILENGSLTIVQLE